jgi:hypothetical protein
MAILTVEQIELESPKSAEALIFDMAILQGRTLTGLALRR